jgi:PEP-CTERM motif
MCVRNNWRRLTRCLLVVGLMATGSLLVVQSASADTLHYVITGPVGTATFDLPQTPVVVSSTGQDFLVTVNNGSANLWGYNLSVPPFQLEFSNLSAGGGLGIDVPFGDLQLTGSQMFTGPDSAPVLSTGTFQLSGGTTVTVTTPEPSTLLLLGCGLTALVVLCKRHASS